MEDPRAGREDADHVLALGHPSRSSSQRYSNLLLY